MYSPKAIANYFIELSEQAGEALTPMKLQKLVYYAHGWFAGHTGKPLIDESVEAWQYGPVIPSLYREFKQAGAGAIRTRATDFDTAKGDFVPVLVPGDPSMQQYLRNVWTSYGKFTAIKLSDMTHASDGPWAATRLANPGVRGADIPFDQIRAHFSEAAKRAAAQKAHAA